MYLRLHLVNHQLSKLHLPWTIFLEKASCIALTLSLATIICSVRFIWSLVLLPLRMDIVSEIVSNCVQTAERSLLTIRMSSTTVWILPFTTLFTPFHFCLASSLLLFNQKEYIFSAGSKTHWLAWNATFLFTCYSITEYVESTSFTCVQALQFLFTFAALRILLTDFRCKRRWPLETPTLLSIPKLFLLFADLYCWR